MNAHLNVTLTQTVDRQPLATVHDLPGTNADLTPAELRALAAALQAAAGECETQPMDCPQFRRQHRIYAMTPEGEAISLKEKALENPLPAITATLDLLSTRRLPELKETQAGLEVICGLVSDACNSDQDPVHSFSGLESCGLMYAAQSLSRHLAHTLDDLDQRLKALHSLAVEGQAR